jgi:hypothetical protein
MKRINVTLISPSKVLSAYKNNSEYQTWIDTCIAQGVWGASGNYSIEVLDATAELEAKRQAAEVTPKSVFDSHFNNTSNPHSVTKAQIGLSNVDNTSDANKPISSATQSALDLKENTANRGALNGYAPLEAGKVPSAYLPSYVDEVLEFSQLSQFPTTGEQSVVYLALDTNKAYRWSGSTYVEVSPSDVNSVNGFTGIVTLQKSDLGLGSVDNVSAANLRTRSTHTGNETVLSWNESSTPSVPSVGVSTYVKDVGGRQMFAQIGKSGVDYSFQPFFARNAVFAFKANGNATTSTVFGGAAPTGNGTATIRNVATTNFFTWMRRVGYVSAATGNASSGLRSTVLQFGIGNGTGRGGFHFVARFGISDATLATGARLFVGLTSSNAVLGNAEPSSFTNIIGVGLDAADTTLQIMHNDGTGTATKIDLGASFPESTNTDFYELSLYCPPNGIEVDYQVVNLSTGVSTTGAIITNIPLNTQLLTWQIWRHNAATGLAVGVDVASVYLETDN